MPHRTIKDVFGRNWDVWEVVPKPLIDRRDEREAADRGYFAAGWLTFQWDHERRRLAPVPEGWVGWSEEDLQRLLERATPAGKPRRLVE